MEPHLGLLPWTLVEVGSFLGSPQQVRPCSQVASLTPSIATTYLASIVEKITIDYKDIFQEIAVIRKVKT